MQSISNAPEADSWAQVAPWLDAAMDNTGLHGRFSIDLAWDRRDFEHQNPDALKQALLDELGLELSPAKEPVEMLVVQQSK